ncbi:MAG: translation elongation factor 4 [bacterium]|nr:translation elongation factor 4 [bacterium]
MNKIRNFCIIAHIDHGKSTLADRMLEITGTIEKRKMKDQVLDRMDLERERGITIKLQPVRMDYQGYILNLIDTPGHVDFTYEVSRSLAAVEGAVLLVDATQGIQAQTLANLYLALEQNLTIIPVINKIDLPAANVLKTKNEIIKLLGCQAEEIICASGKTGQGVAEILEAVIERVPEPKIITDNAPLRALIFDSNYDEYRGVVAYVRIFDGQIKKGDKINLLATKAKSEALDVGVFKPDYMSTGKLETGEIGYIVTGFKDVSECRVGDTVSTERGSTSIRQLAEEVEPLRGYNQVKPMVFAGIFPREGNEFQELRESIAKLKLNDASLMYEPEHSEALGLGFRCGFLGLLHLEIFQERLKREYNLDLIVTIPSVAYMVHPVKSRHVVGSRSEFNGVNKKNGDNLIIRSPQKLPDPNEIEKIEEPWVSLDIITPKDFIGAVMNLVQDKRGIYKNTEYIDETRVILHYQLPMAAILTDFYDKIKSASSGYASINYEFIAYRPADVVKMDILVAEDAVEALANIVYRDEAFRRGKEIVEALKEALPKQMFVVKLQASVYGKVIAAERIAAMRKDVTAKLYGGDVSRKRKLLEKQKKGKKKMMASGKGSVEIPGDVFVKLLKR